MTGHLSGLIAIIAVQLGAVFADGTTPWPAKIAAALATLFTLVVADRTKQQQITTVVVGLIGLAVPLLTFALTKMHPGALAANLVTVVLGVFVRLPALLPSSTNDGQIHPPTGPIPPPRSSSVSPWCWPPVTTSPRTSFSAQSWTARRSTRRRPPRLRRSRPV